MNMILGASVSGIGERWDSMEVAWADTYQGRTERIIDQLLCLRGKDSFTCYVGRLDGATIEHNWVSSHMKKELCACETLPSLCIASLGDDTPWKNVRWENS